jgi:hypothetical protein
MVAAQATVAVLSQFASSSSLFAADTRISLIGWSLERTVPVCCDSIVTLR